MQLQFISFKIGSLWSNTVIPALLPLFIAVEEVFTWDDVQSPRRSCLDIFSCPKMMSFEWVLSLGNKNKSHGAKSGLYGGWRSVIILFWAKNSYTSDKFFGTSFAQISLTCRSSVMIWSTSVFGSPTSSAINRTFKRRSRSRTAFTWATLISFLEVEGTPCALFILIALPSILERLVPPEDLGWRQNSIPISCPQQLQHFGTRFSEFRTELNRVMLLQTPLHFRLWQDTKTTMHFANVPTATKVRTQLRKVKLYIRVPSPPASTPTFLSWPLCAAQKNHSHYLWDRPRMGRLRLLFVILLFCSSEIITPRISWVRTNSSDALTQ